MFVHFYEAVLADELLYPLFKDMDPEHPQHVACWLGEVFGGPADYTANHGGHPEMLKHHLNREITEDQRRRWIDLLVTAADECGLPDDPEFRATFMGYIEWGTRLAKVFSQPGATPNLDEPVPLWDWVLPPWQG
jgi:hemoglobin